MNKKIFLSMATLALMFCNLKPVQEKTVSVPEHKVIQTQQSGQTALKIEPDVKIGVLENGLTYYIRQNLKPENRIEMRLAIQAGSILEEEDQQGLAHFTEHMAFNGTTHFEKQELVDYLEGIGMRFGSDLNAFTSFDETVYMLQVPTEDNEIIEQAFQILADWARGILFTAEELEKERGVVLEEWRLGRGARGRIQDKQFPMMFQGSKYAERLPIGKPEILQKAPREAFTRFYDAWYRPDLMGIVLVGDLDPEIMESKLRSYFESLRGPEKPEKRPEFEIPDHKGTLFSADVDPELSQSMVQILYKKDIEPVLYEEQLQRSFTKNLYGAMINDRLRERAKEADPPFLMAFSGFSRMLQNKAMFAQYAMVNEGQFERGIKALFEEEQRVQKYGFTETEFERVKIQFMRGLENQVIESDKTKSRTHAGRYLQHFLSHGKSMLTSDQQFLDYAKTYLPTVKLDDVNQLTLETMTEDNRIILISGPEKEGLTMPTQEDLDRWINEVSEMTVNAYEDEVIDEPLLSNLPDPGPVVTRSFDSEKEITYWELSNHIRVFLKATDFYNDDVSFTAYSPGGSSKADDESLLNAKIAVQLGQQSGFGSFSQVQLDKKLAGTLANASPYIGSLFEGITGSCSTMDLETMFQLIHLKLTHPRIDLEAFESMKHKQREFIRNKMANPSSVFYETFLKEVYQNHPRTKPLTMEDIDQYDAEKAMDFYRDRFSDFGDFTFVFVGNFTLEQMEPLIVKYLGSLPTTGRVEQWEDHHVNPKKGVTPITVKKGIEQKSTVYILFNGETEWTPQKSLAVQSLSKVLSIRLREILREDKGGVYGVGVGTNLKRWPSGRYSSRISFGCSPENVDILIDAAFEEIKRVQAEGIGDEILKKVRESFTRKRELDLKENSFWLSTISTYDKYKLDLKRLDSYSERIAAIDSQMIKDAANAFFDFENVAIGKLLPEKEESAVEPK